VRTSDKTGFIVNRLLVPYLLDAVSRIRRRRGFVSDIDAAMKLGCDIPWGRSRCWILFGLDTTYYITMVMFDEFKERRFASPSLLKRMVMAVGTGRRTAKGFFDWSTGKTRAAGRRAARIRETSSPCERECLLGQKAVYVSLVCVPT